MRFDGGFAKSSSDSGFLNGFIESSVEMPPDGLNGDCVIHYSGQHSNCKMSVKLLNGMKEGMATIVKDGTLFIQIEYHEGVANGLFVEFDDNKRVLWRGYYRNGVRYSEVKKSGKLAGYYEERSVTTGLLVSIAQYDKALRDKSGVCFEYENGEVKRECVYENGVKKHTIREFVDGKMIVFNLSGKKVYEGEFMGDIHNGFKRNGRGYRFDEKGVVKQYGVYNNDQLMLVMMEFDGDEMTEYDENGKRMTVGKFTGDRTTGFKRSGRGYCFNKDETVKQFCVFDDGVVKRVIQTFLDSTMIEYDENGVMCYVGEWKGNMTNGFVREGKGKEFDKDGVTVLYAGEWKNGYRVGKGSDLFEDEMKRDTPEWELCDSILSGRMDSRVKNLLDDYFFLLCDMTTRHANGIIQMNRLFLRIDWTGNTSQGVVFDMNSGRIAMYKNHEWIPAQCTREVIDLDTSGKRWEGCVKSGKPFGYGVLYDEEGRKEYEGFMVDEMKVCYGIEYFSDIGIVKYEGCYMNNSRFGKGILYARNGTAIYSGLWRNNEHYFPQSDGKTMDGHVEFIDIPNNSFNELAFFSLHPSLILLKRIVIGDKCFGKARMFELDGLVALESVLIGEKSFRIGYNERTDGSCRIVNCPKLKSIHIGYRSFKDYHSFELSNLPSLQSIEMGDDCFYYAPSFSLTSLID